MTMKVSAEVIHLLSAEREAVGRPHAEAKVSEYTVQKILVIMSAQVSALTGKPVILEFVNKTSDANPLRELAELKVTVM